MIRYWLNWYIFEWTLTCNIILTINRHWLRQELSPYLNTKRHYKFTHSLLQHATESSSHNSQGKQTNATIVIWRSVPRCPYRHQPWSPDWGRRWTQIACTASCDLRSVICWARWPSWRGAQRSWRSCSTPWGRWPGSELKNVKYFMW